MKKSTWQQLLENTIPVLLSLTAIISAIGTFANTGKIIGLKLGLVLLLLVCIICFILAILLKAKRIKWTFKSGYTGRPKKFDSRTVLYFGYIITFLAVMCVNNWVRIYLDDQQPVMVKPVFSRMNGVQNLLILPWQRECDYEGKKYDIGLVLKKRLDNLTIKDSLNLRVYYLDDSTNYTNFNKDSAYALMRYHRASMILHGSYSFSACEGGNSDKICYMYQLDTKNMDSEVTHFGSEYKMIDMHGLEDIREGTGQENIDFIIYWVAAMSEFRNSNYTKAIRMFEKIKDYQSKPTVLFQISNCYNYMNDFRNARTMLEKVLLLDPDHEEANLHMSLYWMKEGKIKLIKKQLEKVQSNNPKNISVLRDLCLIYRALKDTVSSDLVLNKFLKEVPESDSTYKALGAMYKDIKDYSKAKDYYEKAFAVCSRHADDWNVLGQLYLLLKDTVKATPYFTKALQLNSRSFTALYNTGMLLQREKKYSKAQNYLQTAVQLEPLDVNALFAMGDNYAALQEQAKAISYYEKALAINPDMPLVRIAAAAMYMDLKKIEQADKYLEQVMVFYKYDPQLLSSLGLLCARKGNYKRAEVYYKRLLKLAPDNGAILYNLASVSGCQHNQVRSLKYLSRALASMPTLKKMARRDGAFEDLRTNKEFIAITQ